MVQVEARAHEVWGGKDGLEEERERKREARETKREKKYVKEIQSELQFHVQATLPLTWHGFSTRAYGPLSCCRIK